MKSKVLALLEWLMKPCVIWLCLFFFFFFQLLYPSHTGVFSVPFHLCTSPVCIHYLNLCLCPLKTHLSSWCLIFQIYMFYISPYFQFLTWISFCCSNLLNVCLHISLQVAWRWERDLLFISLHIGWCLVSVSIAENYFIFTNHRFIWKSNSSVCLPL